MSDHDVRDRSGRLASGEAAPARGEDVIELATVQGAHVEQILSGRVTTPVDYLQDHDEWVMVLEGTAVVDLEGAPVAMAAGDWILLPANQPHRLTSVEPGTTWLAVHGSPPGARRPEARLVVRREQEGDAEAIRRVHAAAFPCPDGATLPVEVGLVDDLRASTAWVPALSLVAELEGGVVGHVLCSKATLGDSDEPALGLGPLGVLPAHQRTGVGSALMYAVIGAADALGEALIALLGDPRYYGRFGFRQASELGIDAPDPSWSTAFQALPLTAHRPELRGRFRYATRFDATWARPDAC